MCCPTDEFKNSVASIGKITSYIKSKDDQGIENIFYQAWKQSSQGHYQLLYDMFTKYATFIATYENLKSDLLKFTNLVGDDIQTRIDTIPPVNVSNNVNYKEMYTDTLSNLVKESCTEIITTHGYTL